MRTVALVLCISPLTGRKSCKFVKVQQWKAEIEYQSPDGAKVLQDMIGKEEQAIEFVSVP